MQVATILPTKYIEYAKDDKYHLCLAHLIGVDDKYTDFFRRQVRRGHFVIMDNGAAEDAQPSVETLIERAQMVKPSEVALPDVIHNKDLTLELSRAAMEEFFRTGKIWNFMAIPQGETFEDWIECAATMLTWPSFVTSIGVSKFLTQRYGQDARKRAVEQLARLQSVKRKSRSLAMPKAIHLLGCWEHPLEIGTIGNRFIIRGTDSAIAYIYTKAGEVLMNQPRPEGVEIDFMGDDKVDENLLKANIKNWGTWCNVGEL